MDYKNIKFRAWHKEQKKMYIVSAFDIINELVCLHKYKGIKEDIIWISFDEVELMMYTGQQDKHGKDIYEGDIVKSFNVVDTVYWNDEYCCFSGRDYEGYDNGSYSVETEYTKHREIIGNKYENPELV